MRTHRLVAVMVASLASCGVTTLAIWIVSRAQEWARRQSVHLKSFAAGMLIALSFLHLVPKSFQMNPRAPVFLLGGFLGIYLANRLLDLYVRQKGEPVKVSESIVPALGIGFHSFVDGLIYSVTFSVSIFTGVLSVLSMILHEFPEGIIAFVLVARNDQSRCQSMLYAFLVAALSTPMGALVAYPLVRQVGQPVQGGLLALSAGVLLYVGASHLLPSVAEEGKHQGILTLATLSGGVLVAVLIILFRE